MLDLDDCILEGSAIPAPFLRDGLTRVVAVPATIPGWDRLRRSLRFAAPSNVNVAASLATALGYDRSLKQPIVVTREGAEDGGSLLQSADGIRLRAWTVGSGTDLDATGGAYRYSPTRIAQRVLLASGERAGLLINGSELRLLLSDPSRADSHLSIPTDTWPHAAAPPDSVRLIAGLVGARALPKLPSVLEAARLHQTRVTTLLRRQARDAITGFLDALPHLDGSAEALWHDALILIYRLLFILKLEAAGGGFSFASTRLWRTSLSPNLALGPLVRRHLDRGHDTGRMLETGLRSLFAIFRDGLSCAEIAIPPLGGALFGAGTMPLLDRLEWGDRAVAVLLDRLIWTRPAAERARVHYGALDVEELGSVYETLLELHPEIATRPLVRLRQGQTETIVPAGAQPPDILPGRFFLRTGSARKSSGSFYTPHEFVRFLVREALTPRIEALSPADDPHPARLLTITVVDPACGSGHFLVEACRFLADALLAACLACDERGLHDRLTALPDIVPYLPSHGYAEAMARAICRRLVAVHCLYGCDRNKLAVDLAKVSLWLESYAEGLPLTFLDHRLLHGDALTGPFSAALATLPVTGGPLDPLLARGVAERLAAGVARARSLIGELDASIGRDIGDLSEKHVAKQRVDAILAPLHGLARAWAGAAMTAARDADDIWLALATRVAETGAWPDQLTYREKALLDAGRHAVAWDLAFPEIFPHGFAAVVGNPPWDVVLPSTKDFVAEHAPAIRDQGPIEMTPLTDPILAAAHETYRNGFRQFRSLVARLYKHQRGSGSLDLYRLFAERAMDLAAGDGAIGLLLPAAFHANGGAAGVRNLYLRHASLETCLSFENRRRIFDIDSRFKFDAIVARRPGPTSRIRCGFYLERMQDAADPDRVMSYDTAFLRRTGGTPLELRGHADLSVADTFFANPDRLGDWCRRHRIRFGCDLHMTADSHLFQPPAAHRLPLLEGKTFHQYSPTWDSKPRYAVDMNALPDTLAETIRHPRLAFRDIARPNDERTMIAFIAPPGSVFGHTATVEKTPASRDPEDARALCAIFNSFPFDWLVRLKATTHLSLYLLDDIPLPPLSPAVRRFLADAASRLDGLPNQPLRTRVDAAVAHAYGLTAAQYRHVLAGFSHRSHPDAPAACLAAFDAAPALTSG